jgi:hypothetical protein
VKLDRSTEVSFGDCELCIGDELVKEAILEEAAAARRATADAPRSADSPAPRPAPPPLPEPRTPPAPSAPASSEVSLEDAALAGRRRRNTGATIVDMQLPPKHDA